MSRAKALILLLFLTIASFSYILWDDYDRADSFNVSFSDELKNDLEENLSVYEINDLIINISENLTLRKSAKGKNSDMLVDKFKNLDLVNNICEEEFVKENVIIDLK